MPVAGDPPAPAAPGDALPDAAALLRGRSDDVRVQLLRYVLVGGGAFLVDFGTLGLLHHLLGLHYLLAAAAGFSLGLLVNYAISVRWVFSVRRAGDRRVELLVYALVGVVGLLLNHLVIWGLSGGLSLEPLLAKLVSAALVLAWNFGARKVLLF